MKEEMEMVSFRMTKTISVTVDVEVEIETEPGQVLAQHVTNHDEIKAAIDAAVLSRDWQAELEADAVDAAASMADLDMVGNW